MRTQHKALAALTAMLCSTLAWADSTTLARFRKRPNAVAINRARHLYPSMARS